MVQQHYHSIGNPMIHWEEALLKTSIGPMLATLGIASAVIFSVLGSAIGIARCTVGICSMEMKKEGLLMKSMLPIVMASVNAIYGLVLAIIIAQKLRNGYTLADSFAMLAAGLVCGLSGLGGGYAVGWSGYDGVIMVDQQPKGFIGMVVIQAFASVLSLYGLIVGLTFISG